MHLALIPQKQESVLKKTGLTPMTSGTPEPQLGTVPARCSPAILSHRPPAAAQSSASSTSSTSPSSSACAAHPPPPLAEDAEDVEDVEDSGDNGRRRNQKTAKPNTRATRAHEVEVNGKCDCKGGLNPGGSNVYMAKRN